VKRAGVGTNGILECKFLPENAHPAFLGQMVGVGVTCVDKGRHPVGRLENISNQLRLAATREV
jgi:hypothetical protein